jgi:hypothetical protein
MLINDLKEHEGTIYEHGWAHALGFSCVTLCSSYVSLKWTNYNLPHDNGKF